MQQQHSIRAHVISQDLTEPSAAASIARQIEERGIIIYLLINNASFGDYGSLFESLLDRQASMIQLNISALVELTHAFFPTMLKQKNT